MKNGFTKIYDEEKPLLNQTKSIAAFNVYMHLKDKYSYFKQDVYDYMNYMAEYLGMTERTVKDAIKRLKDVGLIQTKREWVYTDGKPKSINIYSFPIVDKLEKNTEAEVDTKQEEDNEEKQIGCIVTDDNLIGIISIEKFENMKGNIAIEIEEQDFTNEEIIKRASDDFVNQMKINAYTLWVELNDRYRNGEENTSTYQILWKKWVDMWRPYMCTQRRIELQAEITSTVVKRYGKRYLKERQPDTQDVAKTEIGQQNADLSDTFDNFSEELNALLDEYGKVINNAVTRMIRAELFPSKDSEYNISTATKKLDDLCDKLTTDKDKADYQKYVNERIDTIRQDITDATRE